MTLQPDDFHTNTRDVGSIAVNLASGGFYTSDIFWTGAGAVVALVVGVAGVWAALRSSNPKRRLLYSMPVATPLLNTRPDMPQDVEVRRAGKVLAFPQFVNVELTSRGRLDIDRTAFDGGKPLCFDVGAPIIECLKVSVSPSDRSVPEVKIDGAKLLVEPALIGRRETVVFSLLVDGPSPQLSLPEQSLINVDIRQKEQARELDRKLRAVIEGLIIILVAVIAIFLSAWLGLFAGPPGH